MTETYHAGYHSGAFRAREERAIHTSDYPGAVAQRYLDDLLHSRNAKYLGPGQVILYRERDGAIFAYRVHEVEVVMPTKTLKIVGAP